MAEKQKFTLLKLLGAEYQKKETWEQKLFNISSSLDKYSNICVIFWHPQYPRVLVVAGGLGESLRFSMNMLEIREYSIQEVEGRGNLPFLLPNF